MLDHEQLLPAETQEENQLLIRDLSRYFETRTEDDASLVRIRARLLQKTATTLPIADHVREIPAPTLLPIRRERNTRMNLTHALAWGRSRHPYLRTLAAAVLLAVLVGSFTLTLHLRQGATAISKTPAIAHGWSIVGNFSGTGNRAFMNQDIEVGHKYGWLINCTTTTSDFVTLKLNGQGAGGIACPSNIIGPLAPTGSYTSPIKFAPILTIEVSAAASTSWTLQLFKGTYYPPLSFGPDFRALHDEMDGTGNETVLMDVTLPETILVGFECRGTGTFAVGLWSAYPTPSSPPDVIGYTSPCDGQLHGNVDSAHSQGTIVHQIQITTSRDNNWQVLLAGCTNGKPSCGGRTVNQTVTP